VALVTCDADGIEILDTAQLGSVQVPQKVHKRFRILHAQGGELEQQQTALGAQLSACSREGARISTVVEEGLPALVVAAGAVFACVRGRSADVDDQALEIVGVDMVAYLGGEAEEWRKLLIAGCAARLISTACESERTHCDSHVVCSFSGESSKLLHERGWTCCHVVWI